MYTKDDKGYQSPVDFAKTYCNARSKKPGVSKKYIYDLIERERTSPGSTNIDVWEICGKVFVRYRVTPVFSKLSDEPK